MIIPVIGKKVYKEDVKSEHLEQVQFIQWIKRNHPGHRIFAIPNGGTRSKAVGAKLKAEGVSRGVPDLFIPSLKLFIEMKKTKGSTTSPEQMAWIGYLRSVGYHAEICKGKDEAIKVVENVINNC